MDLGFETLESRGTVSRTIASVLTCELPWTSRAVAMPLRHEIKIYRRRPPAGYEKWVEAEGRVHAPPPRLWAAAYPQELMG
jgi:hypothetical protein